MVETTPAPLFNEWLRVQLRAKRMSQRQLAERSGVDKSTISRLIRQARVPSYSTVLKLAAGLREENADSGPVFRTMALGHPIAQVEYALRSDGDLDDITVAMIMDRYLELRRRAPRHEAELRTLNRRVRQACSAKR